MKRRQDNLLQNKPAKLFTRNDKKKCWSEIRRLNHTQLRLIPCVDGVSGSTSIANILASKFKGVLNRNSNALQISFYSTLQSSVTDTLISEVYFSEEDVVEANLIHTSMMPVGYAQSTSSSLLLSSRSLLLHFSLLWSDTGICQVAFVTVSPFPY